MISKICILFSFIFFYFEIYSQNITIDKEYEKKIDIDTILSRRIILEKQKVFYRLSEKKRNEYQDLALSAFLFQKGLFEKEFSFVNKDSATIVFNALHSLNSFFMIDIASSPSNSSLKSIILVKEKKIGFLYLTKLHSGNYIFDIEDLNYRFPFNKRKIVLKNTPKDCIIMVTKVKKIHNKYRISVSTYQKYHNKPRLQILMKESVLLRN